MDNQPSNKVNYLQSEPNICNNFLIRLKQHRQFLISSNSIDALI